MPRHLLPLLLLCCSAAASGGQEATLRVGITKLPPAHLAWSEVLRLRDVADRSDPDIARLMRESGDGYNLTREQFDAILTLSE